VAAAVVAVGVAVVAAWWRACVRSLVQL
jgi:hypothetical protein